MGKVRLFFITGGYTEYPIERLDFVHGDSVLLKSPMAYVSGVEYIVVVEEENNE